MNNARKMNLNYERFAWGALLLWWGIRWLFDFLPNGTGLLGTGLIMLGVNAARSLNGMPARGLTTALGILTLVLGGLVLASSVLTLPFELPIFAILLIALGVFVLVRAYNKPETNDVSYS